MTSTRTRLVEQVTAPSIEPISLDEAKAYLRIEQSDEDTLISELIAGARRAAEEYMGRLLMHQRWKLAYDGYAPESAPLPFGPASEVISVTIFLIDETSSAVDGSHYYLSADKHHLHFEITPCGHRVEIIYDAGVTLASDVPASIKQGLLAHVAELYERRERSSMPETTKMLYNPHREVRL